MHIDFVGPWVAVGSERDLFEAELRRELLPDSQLSSLNLRTIGRRIDCDDVLFEVCDEKADFKLALVHLTWSGKFESGLWPSTTLFSDAKTFMNRMVTDMHNYVP